LIRREDDDRRARLHSTVKIDQISEVLRQLGPDADRVGALFITLDPERGPGG
jgi:hypothetical protein